MSPKIIIGKMLTKNLPILPSNKSQLNYQSIRKLKLQILKLVQEGTMVIYKVKVD